MRLPSLIRLATFAAVLTALPALAADAVISRPPLDHGFLLLYSLDFDGAHNLFAAWEQSHPDDPMGPTADAAGLLFSEFHRLGVLESQFFESDKRFDNRPKPNADPAVRDRFNAAIQKSRRHRTCAAVEKSERPRFAVCLDADQRLARRLRGADREAQSRFFEVHERGHQLGAANAGG